MGKKVTKNLEYIFEDINYVQACLPLTFYVMFSVLFLVYYPYTSYTLGYAFSNTTYAKKKFRKCKWYICNQKAVAVFLLVC